MTKASSSTKSANPAVEAELDRLATAPIVELRMRYRVLSIPTELWIAPADGTD